MIDTDTVWTVAAKKALENMDRDSLKRILNATFGLLETQADVMTKSLILHELQRRNKEEKKMEDKKYHSGTVKVTTWRTRKPFNNHDYVATNYRTDIITFKDGKFMGALSDPKNELPTRMPFDVLKKYTKEEITEAITNIWDEGRYAADQTDISWIFNPDPEGFTGTVDLATVLLKDLEGNNGGYRELVRARCRVRIVDGKFFEKLDGSSKLADILKNYRYEFSTKEDIVKYIKGKWCVRDFGNDASYYILNIEEEL